MKYKAIAIENDRDIPRSLKGFIMDNPDLFKGKVEVLGFAKHRPEIVAEALKTGVNAILVSSTFMYKEQLENNVKLFNASGLKLTFFVQYGITQLNDFISTSCGVPCDRNDFIDYNTFIEIIKKWVKEGLVYTIVEDNDSKIQLFDEFHNWSTYEKKNRSPWKAIKILYSEKYNMFYEEQDDEDFCLHSLKYIHK